MKRPLPLDPASFAAQTGTLNTRELGVLLRYAMHFWAAGSLPEGRAALAALAKVSPTAIDDINDRVLPFFAPGSLFPILREAQMAKHLRRVETGRVNGARGGRPPKRAEISH